MKRRTFLGFAAAVAVPLPSIKPPAPVPQTTTIHLQGDLFTKNEIRELLFTLQDAGGMARK